MAINDGNKIEFVCKIERNINSHSHGNASLPKLSILSHPMDSNGKKMKKNTSLGIGLHHLGDCNVDVLFKLHLNSFPLLPFIIGCQTGC